MEIRNTTMISGQRRRMTLFLSASFLMALTVIAHAAEVGEAAGVDKETMFSLVKKGGAVMIPLAIGSIIALALGLERFLSLRKEKVLPANFVKGLSEAWDSDPTGQAAEEFCDKSGGAAGHVFKAGLQWREEGHQAVYKAIEDAGAREADKMKRSLRPLSIIASVSPLLGLLGTVYGMIESFQATATSGGAAKTADLANGIYEALVSTAAGLTIAIPVMLLFQWLSTRVDAIIDHIDEVGTEFLLGHARRTSGNNTGSHEE
jgi:biopolymer transport protein ExbB